MGIRVTELRGRELDAGDGLSTVRKYQVRGTAGTSPSEEDVYGAISMQSPQMIYIDSEPLARISLSAQEIALRTWEATVAYGPQSTTGGGNADPELDLSRSFSVQGQTVHITQALAHIDSSARSGKQATDHKGTIGLDSEGNIAGADIIVPQFTMQNTRYFPETVVKSGFIKTLSTYVACVNSSPFRSFAAGEVLFTGLSGAFNQTTRLWALTYQFACEPNVTGLTFGDVEAIDKQGHDYLWLEYLDKHDSSSKFTRKIPIQANVERVYRRADLNWLDS